MGADSLLHGAPRIEMLPNPDFSFPMAPRASLMPNTEGPRSSRNRRPISMHGDASKASTTILAHRRTQSTLPTFSFNSADTTGLADDNSPTLSPEDTTPTTPVKRGHRRGGSEFVGGDSRLGVDGAISSSPTKAEAAPMPISSPGTARQRGHAHSRSNAMSSHDVTSMMRPTEAPPRMSSSLPCTPLELPAPRDRDDSTSEEATSTSAADPFGASLNADAEDARPPSRPRVGFSDNVEYIPRPLSTISSDSGGSQSTTRGHSVNNSISSVLNMDSPNLSASRNSRNLLSTTFEDGAKPRPSAEISKRIEREGEWLSSSRASSVDRGARPLSEPGTRSHRLTFLETDPHAKLQKRNLAAPAIDSRRRSEPSLSGKMDDASQSFVPPSRKQLERPKLTERASSRSLESKPSKKSIKDRVLSMINIKPRDPKHDAGDRGHTAAVRPRSAGDAPLASNADQLDAATAETNLDTVFSNPDVENELASTATSPSPRFASFVPSTFKPFGMRSQEDGTFGMVDMNDAIVSKAPSSATHKQMREMHSSRLAKDFSGPGGHYHRRAESLPNMAPFEFGTGSKSAQKSMPDVFEDEEEEVSDDEPAQLLPSLPQSGPIGIGIQIVDADATEHSAGWGFPSSQARQQSAWEPERPSTSYGLTNSRLSTPTLERRASSIMEDTIIEESSPVERIEVVESFEEPRSSSLTKSSDSSETPTLLASQTGPLALPDGQHNLMTPDTYQTSTFSSPDLNRRQSSFDTSRLGTSASSITDGRAMSTGTGEPHPDFRKSVDDVPSLTSSRSTMVSTMHPNTSRRDIGTSERTPSVASGNLDPKVVAERQRNKRSSVGSISQLLVDQFGKSRSHSETRSTDTESGKGPKKEHRLKKLMFWRSKSQSKLRPDS